jgi:hypothetical protein
MFDEMWQMCRMDVRKLTEGRVMPEPNTLKTMDDNELLGKIDELFEWLARQAGEGPIEAWTLAGLQTEIRRRIMERHAAVVIEPEPERIKVEVTTIPLTSEKTVRPPARTTFYDVALFNSRGSWEERCTSEAELKKFLRGIEATASFGLLIEKATYAL